MAVRKGDIVGIYEGATLVAGGMVASVTGSNELIDITTKDSGGNKEYLPGDNDYDFVVECKHDPGASKNAETYFDGIEAGTEFTIKYSSGVSSSTLYTATAIVQSWGLNAAKQEAEMLNVTFKATGGVTSGTEA